MELILLRLSGPKHPQLILAPSIYFNKTIEKNMVNKNSVASRELLSLSLPIIIKPRPISIDGIEKAAILINLSGSKAKSFNTFMNSFISRNFKKPEARIVRPKRIRNAKRAFLLIEIMNKEMKWFFKNNKYLFLL